MTRKEIRDRGVNAVRRVAPHLVESLARRRDAPPQGDLSARVTALQARVEELEDEVQENRQLNRRLAELTDVVQELLVPIARGDKERLSEIVDRYSNSL